jgi:hypothetical protein
MMHDGMKLVAKRKSIKGNYTGNGILYLKTYEGEIIGKYMRSEVGKFEISDKINSKWYFPTITLANIKISLDINDYDLDSFKINLKNKIKSSKFIRFKKTSKIKLILNKISTLSSYNKEMKRLFGLGVDYVVFIEFLPQKKIKLSIVSTYTNKAVFNTFIAID